MEFSCVLFSYIIPKNTAAKTFVAKITKKAPSSRSKGSLGAFYHNVNHVISFDTVILTKHITFKKKSE